VKKKTGTGEQKEKAEGGGRRGGQNQLKKEMKVFAENKEERQKRLKKLSKKNKKTKRSPLARR